MKLFTRILAVFTLFLFINDQMLQGQLAGQIPLNPKAVPQFVDPLPHFAGARINAKSPANLTVKMVPHDQITLSTGTMINGGLINPVLNPLFGKTHLWVYQISTDGVNFTPKNWPAFTIEAAKGSALNVTYENNLSEETYDKVGLVVDQTLHWADPMMTMGSIAPYDGFPPAVVHLHGGEVPPLSDGGPDSWFTPGYAETGPAFNGTPASIGTPGKPKPYIYPNTQEAATLWFHDHALGVTRLNVYAGMAGFYLLRDARELNETEAGNIRLPGWPKDDKVQQYDRVTGKPVGQPYLPEIEIAIQDRMFDTNGQLYFPILPPNGDHPYWTPEFVGDIITVNGKTWPYLSVAPRRYRFRILNGSNARTYELWLQNLATGAFGPSINQIGTDGGFLGAPVVINPALGQKLVLMPGERADVIIDFTGNPTGTVWTIRNSGRTPYPNGAPPSGSTLGRIMQFVVNGKMVDNIDSRLTGTDKSLPVSSLNLRSAATPLIQLTDFAGRLSNPGPIVEKIRQLTLNEVMGMGGPLEILVNNTKWNGLSVATDKFDKGIRTDFSSPPLDPEGHPIYVSESIKEGTTEVWKIINLTADAHPIHLHLVQFQLMSRQNFSVSAYNKVYNALFPGSTAINPMTGLAYPKGVFIGGYGPPDLYNKNQSPNLTGIPVIGGNPDVTPYLQGPVKPANSNERGWKDTFTMYPGQVTTVIARWAPTDKDASTAASNLFFPFDPSGGHGYVWHCHIIDHEDNEMMRPYLVETNKNYPDRIVKQTLRSLNSSGNVARNASVTNNQTAVEQMQSEIIDKVVLGQNYPNPFSDVTEIAFNLPQAARVTLTLYNSAGMKIKVLLDVNAPAGVNTVRFDGTGLADGIYFYQLKTGLNTIVKRMVVKK